ncbi:HaeIII family restriction endonuclease [Helicobacter cappadocius]|uniref:HaeIII family restriction endonuclease n=1 Tax=Helicobacter cappadocius TaxID=3063998 RepID=A0AA90PRI7_9HELI|nr:MULTISPECIES: HaeIII family restriction endonuclease [unclassified Helicobacter]MDO7253753.1 HaeIII family restriction endonuclease [Helicobacter sp. faydin-H75]MDP2539681.1 HaeIII family restriction endonuclease [Helicobacter sp. faydin-H76]
MSPKIIIPEIELPTRIIEIAFKNNSKTTVILTMDNGWSISFRIHNASSKIEPSLKFDIQLQSKPENIFYINKQW